MITLIDGIKDPAPLMIRQPKPTSFKTSLDEMKYWATEIKRWREGYEGIPGMMYWYVTQVKLKNRITGEVFRPTPRDADLLIFSTLEDCFKKGESPFIIKGRGIGLSSIGMNMCHYFHRVYPGSKSIATSKDKMTLGTLFTDKTMVSFDELDPAIKPDLLNKNQTKSEAYLKVGFKYLDKEDLEKYAECEFTCRDTQESDKAATNFSGSGAIYGFADEAPLMPRFQKFFDSAREVFTNHSMNRMEGLLFSGGTCEDTIKSEDISRIMNIWYNAQTMHIRPLFIPATFGKHMVNGHSNHKKAEEEILKRREELKSMPDSLKAYIKNNPLTIDEIFDIGRGGRWEDDVTDILIRQEKIILSSKPPVHPYKLVKVSDNHIVAEPAKESPLLILEHPKPGIKYFIGIDGTATSKESSQGKESQNSNFALVVRKGADPNGDSYRMVAELELRPDKMEQVYIMAANIIRYYNKYDLCKVSAEGNAGNAEHFGQFLSNEGLKKVLDSRKKMDASGKEVTDKVFFYRDVGMLDWQYRQGNIDLRKYGPSILFIRTVRSMMKPLEENADLTDAYLACQVGMGANYDKIVEKKVVKPRQTVSYEYDPQFGFKTVWKDA
jgi:hypothetical protein